MFYCRFSLHFESFFVNMWYSRLVTLLSMVILTTVLSRDWLDLVMLLQAKSALKRTNLIGLDLVRLRVRVVRFYLHSVSSLSIIPEASVNGI